ncbi:polysaccharide deacetylase family protein [Microvirga brassicacearum]|uniref:polysaccharide deacetylase family protein n=1 Tax=Microvirga brassicacearum TaxID=2580413 RepID=UPI0013917A07|nr:polysaccharide deacetylase family protein [Microvirga brassicacearum]
MLQIEHYELLTPEGAKGEFGTFTSDYRTWPYRQYGNRVGFYRVLEILDELAVPVTAAIGAGAIEAHPEIVTEIVSRRYEIAVHGLTANRMITSRMTEDEERAHIQHSRDALRTTFGASPRGWLSAHTSHVRASARSRLVYTMDWANDEKPYRPLDAGGLIALPAPSGWDDVQTLWLRKLSADRFPRLVSDAIDALARASAMSARAVAIGIHPWVFEAAHCIRYLRETLAVAGRVYS